MKKILLILNLLFLCIAVIAQTYRGVQADNIIKGSKKVIINADNTIRFAGMDINNTIAEENHPSWLRQILRLSSHHSLKLMRAEPDNTDYTHYRYQLLYHQYPVEGAVYYAHIKDNRVVSVNGDIPAASKKTLQIKLKPEEAYLRAKTFFNNSKAHQLINDTPEHDKVIVSENDSYILCYKFDIYSIKPLSRYFIYVDAENGKIVKAVDRIWFSDTTATAETMYHGTKEIVADSYNGSYRLRENSRGGGIETYDMNNTVEHIYAVDFTDADNYWNTSTDLDNAAYDAHYGAEMTYDYFYTMFGRNSYDNMGSALINYVHYDYDYNNAFWDGESMTFGDGDGSLYNPLTSTDVVGHEIAHGVTQFTAGLEYSYESGALNESFSDIFGILIDYYANPATANFMMGEEFSVDGTPMRSMSDPNQTGHPDTYLGNYWETTSYDNGGVHINSSVMNYWFYLLCYGGSGTNDNGTNYSISPIGMDAAARIAYRNLTVYLTMFSQYADARQYSIQAAEDLFGPCSEEVIMVTNAWQAVGVGDAFNDAVTAGFIASNTYLCSIPTDVSFTNTSTNGNSFFWSFGDGATSTSEHPIHTYASVGAYSVSLLVQGNATCGNADSVNLIDYITVTNTGGPVAAACIPQAPTTTSNIGIYSVDINTISNTSGNATEGYEDFTCTAVTTVTEGHMYPMSVTTGAMQYEDVFAWIDLNSDGLFNNDQEFVFHSNDKMQYHNSQVIIPGGALYNVPLRFRIASDFAGTPIDSACTNPAYGQYEDYTLTVLENFSAVEAGFTSDITTCSPGDSIQFLDQTLNVPTSWSWQFPGGIPSSSTEQHPVITYQTLGSYDVTLIVSNIYGTDTITKQDYVKVSNSFDMCNDVSSTELSGIVYDPGGETANYGNNESCGFLIEVDCAFEIELTFLELSMESGYDYIRVYDGTSTSGNYLLSASGTNIPAPVVATSGAMYLYFTSDGSVNFSGFKASWVATTPNGQSPVADFSISDTLPPFGTDVQFADLTTNNPVEWLWDFGDGSTSNLQNPSHIYNSSGLQTITLIADNCVSADTVQHTLIVQDATGILINPYAYNITFTACSDTVTESLSIINTGSEEIVFELHNYTGSASNVIISEISAGTPDYIEIMNVSDEPVDVSGWTVSVSTDHNNINTVNPVSWTLNGIVQPGELLFRDDNSSGVNYWGSNINWSVAYAGWAIILDETGAVVDFIAWEFDEVTIQEMETVIYGYTVTIDQFWIGEGASYPVNSAVLLRQGNSDNNSSLDFVTGAGSFGSVNDNIQVPFSFASSDENIGFSPNNGVIPPGDTALINITFYATDFPQGNYSDVITLLTNTSGAPEIIIPYAMSVSGEPGIEFEAACLDFGEAMELSTILDSVIIYNSGCGELIISMISSTQPEFQPAFDSLRIPPYDSVYLPVSFSPSAEGVYSASLLIENNDTDTVICLSGVGTAVPAISVLPDSIYVSISNCNDSVQQSVMIYNTGEGILHFDITDSIAGFVQTGVNEGFEDGTYNDWSLHPDHSAQIITNNPGSGNYSVEITGGNAYLNNGLSRSVLPDTINYLSVKIKPTDAAGIGPMFIAGDENSFMNNGIIWLYFGSGDVITLSGSSNYISFIPNQWYHFEFKNINYVSKTFDYYLDGALIESGVSFNSSASTYISNIDLFNYNFTSSCYDDIVVGSNNQPLTWINYSPDNGTIMNNDSLAVEIQFNADNLNEGIYETTLILSSNDPANSEILVPCIMEISGVPNLSTNLGGTCVEFGDQMTGSTSVDSVEIINTGCATLNISGLSSGSAHFNAYPAALSIPPGSSAWINISFSPDAVDSFNGIIQLNSNDLDTVICVNGSGVPAPVCTYSPSAISVSVSCDESINIPVSIYNSGPVDLTVDAFAGVPADVLALTYGVDYSNEYTNTISAINQYFTNYFLTEINTTSSAELASALAGKDILLIADPENASPSVFSSFSTVLTDFVNQGGNILFCGTDNSSCIINTGLFSGSFYTSTSSATINILDQNHPVSAQLPPSFSGSDGTFMYDFINSDRLVLAECYGYDVVTVRELGEGKVIYIGFDYYSYNDYTSQLISNAVKWAASVSDSWITVDTVSAFVGTGDSIVFQAVLSGAGLEGGVYNSEITILTNDPLNQEITIPCELTVSYSPCADFEYNVSLCTGEVEFSDASLNTPTSWSWSFGDGEVADQQSPVHEYTSTGIYTVELIVCNVLACDTVEYQVAVLGMSGPISASCTPYASSSYEDIGIFQVILGDINNNTGLDSTGYQDYSCDYFTNLTAGYSYSLQVACGATYPQNVCAWIDYNNNASFEPDEKIMESYSQLDHLLNFSIPDSSEMYEPLRLRIMSDYYGSAVPEACTDVVYGQIEDYAVLILPDTVPPEAAFIYSIVNQCQGIVQFTDQSINNPTQWYWDFGDGAIAEEANPFHTFTQNGVYDVTLAALNDYGLSQYNMTVVISGALHAQIQIGGNLVAFDTVLFTSSPDNAIYWQWDFGDGTTDTAQHAQHIYDTTGTFTVELQIEDQNGCSSSASASIEIMEPESTESMRFPEQQIDVFPNPFQDKFTVIFRNHSCQDCELSILNILGEEILSKKLTKVNSRKTEIVLTGYPAGLYFIKIGAGGNQFGKRLIKQ